MILALFAGCSQTCGHHVPRDTLDAQAVFLDAAAGALHPLVGVGDGVDQLSTALFDLLRTYYFQDGDVGVPQGFVYDGAGGYTSATSTARSAVQFLYGDDFNVGAEDALVVPNLFDPDSYLVGVGVSLDLLTGDLVVDYQETGPLVELLGQGADPPNPLRMTASEGQNPYRIGRLKAVVDATVAKSTADIDVSLHVTGGPSRVKHLIRGVDTLILGVDPFTARAPAGDVLSDEGGDLAYTIAPDTDPISSVFGAKPPSGDLDGTLPFEVRRGDPDLDGDLRFAQSGHAEVESWCAE